MKLLFSGIILLLYTYNLPCGTFLHLKDTEQGGWRLSNNKLITIMKGKFFWHQSQDIHVFWVSEKYNNHETKLDKELGLNQGWSYHMPSKCPH